MGIVNNYIKKGTYKIVLISFIRTVIILSKKFKRKKFVNSA